MTPDTPPDITPDRDIDARDLLCPLPVLKARKALSQMAPGQVLRLVATDHASWVDVPHFCAQAGHEVIHAREAAGAITWLIRRG